MPFLACDNREEKEMGEEKKGPVGITKDFDFELPVISIIFKLTI